MYNTITTRQLENPRFFTTQFMDWLRHRHRLDQSLGYVVSDLDCIIRNYKTGRMLMLEEKCRMAKPSYGQQTTLEIVHRAMEAAYPEKYAGLWLLQFEKEYPADGGEIWISRIDEPDQRYLIKDEAMLDTFLCMEWATPEYLLARREKKQAKTTNN
jgi:hypothetical protein